MVTTSRETPNCFNRGICKQYDTIVKKSSYQAENTKELVDLISYVEELKRLGEIELQQRIGRNFAIGQAGDCSRNLLFLMDYAYLPKDNMIINNSTFTWPDRILPIVTNAENKLQKEHDIAVNKLQAATAPPHGTTAARGSAQGEGIRQQTEHVRRGEIRRRSPPTAREIRKLQRGGRTVLRL
ncbi:hypothetical protein ACOMHN_013008 [Nucella lapillus]